MYINIEMGTELDKRFRGVESSFKGITFSWSWIDGRNARFSLDERRLGDTLIVTRRGVAVDKVLEVMPPEDFKLAIENSLNMNMATISKTPITSLATLLNSFLWWSAPRPNSHSWDYYYSKAVEEGL